MKNAKTQKQYKPKFQNKRSIPVETYDEKSLFKKYITVGRIFQYVKAAQKRAFTASRRADYGYFFALINLFGNIVQNFSTEKYHVFPCTRRNAGA